MLKHSNFHNGYLFLLLSILFFSFSSISGCDRSGNGEDSAKTKVLEEITVETSNKTILKGINTNEERAIPIGYSLEMTAIGHYSDGSTQDISDQVSWQLSNQEVGQLSKNIFISKLQGLILVKASLDDIKSQDFSIEVTNAHLENIVISQSQPRSGKADITFAKGIKTALIATAYYSDGTAIDVTHLVSWHSNNPTIADVEDGALQILANSGETSIHAKLGNIESQELSVEATQAELLSVNISSKIPKIAKSDLTLAKGMQVKLLATAHYSDGSSPDVTDQVKWKSSNPGVASFKGQFLEANHPGNTNVLASFKGLDSQPLSVESTAATVTSINITANAPYTGNADYTLAKGISIPFTANAYFSDNSVLDVTNAVTWVSDSPDIAKFSKNQLKALSDSSETKVHAVFKGVQSNSKQIKTTSAELISLSINTNASNSSADADISLAKGLKVNFTVTAHYSDNSSLDVTNQAAWNSDTPAVASFTENTLKINSPSGFANVHALYGGLSSDTKTVLAADPELISVSISTDTPKSSSENILLPKGITLAFKAFAYYSDGSSLDVTNEIAWSSSTPDVADFNANTLKANSDIGTTIVHATYAGVKSDSKVIETTAATIESLSISAQAPHTNSADITLPKGVNVSFIAYAHYSDGSSKNVTAQSSWLSDNPSIANFTNNTLEASSNSGSAKVYASFDGISSNTKSIIATNAKIESVSIKTEKTPNALILPKGTQISFVATAHYSDGSTQNVTELASWISNQPHVANFSSNKLDAKADSGNVEIFASFGNVKSNTKTVMVTAAQLAKIVISKTSDGNILPNGTNAEFKAIAHYSDGTTTDITNDASWTSTTPEVANFTKNILEAKAEQGTTEVSAYFNGVQSNKVIIETSHALLTQVTISANTTQSPLRLPKGISLSFKAIAHYSDGESVDITNSASWRSSVSNIANFTKNRLEAKADTGSTQVTALYAGIKSEPINIEVISAILESVSIETNNQDTTISLPHGTSIAFIATAYYSDGMVEDVTSTASWTSKDASIVNFNDNILEAKATHGQATVFATFNNTVSNNFTVYAAPAELQQLNIVGANSLPAYDSTVKEVYTLTGIYSDGTTKPYSGNITWNNIITPSNLASFSEINQELTTHPENDVAGNVHLHACTPAGICATHDILLYSEIIQVKSSEVGGVNKTCEDIGHKSITQDQYKEIMNSSYRPVKWSTWSREYVEWSHHKLKAYIYGRVGIAAASGYFNKAAFIVTTSTGIKVDMFNFVAGTKHGPTHLICQK
ncbi:hypothetical protein [Photobacterium angustum]|uniref:hypothetical protein n=1 Tax=Photobacterium angustum TaxID=661 RepID=UPI000D157D61|nr:hypothetical protein [Photobacterium angustum]PSV64873.1 hypothetical protein CTM95_18350 [Photobacterium angustum]